jgi:hypothetical protein
MDSSKFFVPPQDFDGDIAGFVETIWSQLIAPDENLLGTWFGRVVQHPETLQQYFQPGHVYVTPLR